MKNYYILLAMLSVFLTPLSMKAIGSTPTDDNTTNKALVAGCEGVTVTGNGSSITVAGLGSYSHIQVFTPNFATQVFDQEIRTSSITVPVSAGGYIVKVWSNPNPAAFCESNFPVTVGGGGGGALPLAVNDNRSTPQGTPVTVSVLSNDNVNGTLQSLTVTNNPANGTAVVSGNNIIYTPRAGFSGTDVFTYRISNGNGTSSATVTITVLPQGQAPIANNDNATTPQNTPVTISPLNNDAVNGILQSVTIKSQPANGSVLLNGNNFVFTPNAGFSGTTTFTYCFTTSNGTSNTATVTVNVAAPAPVPVANNDNATTPQNTPVTISPLNNDAVNGILQSVTIKSQPANGSVLLNGNNFVFTPNAGFSCTTTFTYCFTTSNGTSNTATVTVNVAAPAPVPVANNDNATTPQNTPVTISPLNNDAVNGILQSVTIKSQPANGSVLLNGNNFVFTPNAGFSGTTTFTYCFTTSNGTSNTATVTVNVAAPAPVANNDNAITNQNTSVTIPVLNNDNINGTLQIFVIMSNPANGTAIVNGNNIIYTPNQGFCGNDAFTYKIFNGTASSVATVNVTVNCPVDPCATDVTPPVISCPANMVKTPTNGGTCWTNITWSAATATDNCSTPTVLQIAGPTSGSCIGFGVSTVTYKATDARGNISTCSFTITVNRPACIKPTIEFKNNTNCTLYLFCLDNWGGRTYHRSINSGHSCLISSSAGQRWLLCRRDGYVVREHVASSACQQYCTASGCSSGYWLAANDALSMEAKAEVNRVEIGFINNTGFKNDYFTIEKLSDLTGDFEKLETFNNKFTSLDTEYYTTYDNEPSEGDNTYRVKVTYLDGTSTISATQTVKFKGVSDIRAYPNPAVDVVGVDLSKYKGQSVTIALYNQFGQQVLTQQVEKASGTVNLDISQTPMGNYMLRVVSKGRKDALQQLHIAK